MGETTLLIMLFWFVVITINLIYIGYRVIQLEIMLGLHLFKKEKGKVSGGDK